MSYPKDDSNLPDTLVVRTISAGTRTSGYASEQQTDHLSPLKSTMSKRLIRSARPHALPIAIVLIASVIGQYATLAQTTSVRIFDDSVTYLTMTKAILTHANFFDLLRTPGYPAFLAVIALFTGNDGPHRVMAAQAALMVTAAAEVYALTFNLTRRRWIAVLSGAVFGTNLYFLDWERIILSEALALWACVTVFLLLERYLSTGRRAWLVGLTALMFVAIMIRPMYIMLPIVVIALLALRALRRGEFKRTWLELGMVLAVSYLLIVGYMAGNRIVNGYFTLSYVSNVNLLGKILDYQLQNDNSNPQFAQLQADMNTYNAQHPGAGDPWVFMETYPQYDHVPFIAVGQFADGIVEHHLLGFIRHTPPDAIATWHASPYLYAQWNITAGWIGLLELLSGMELGFYTWLPVLLVLLALLAWRTKGAVAPFMLFTMLACVVSNIYVAGAGSYGEYYRLRAPFDWAMVLVTLVVLCQAGVWAVRGLYPDRIAGAATEE